MYKKTYKVLVVEPSLKDDIIRNATTKGDNIGYIPIGYNADFWNPSGKKENIIL